jgi:hypothetical protein
MDRRTALRTLALLLALATAGLANGQFFEGFDAPHVATDSGASAGWAFFTGDGQATMQLIRGGEGYASILVDATRDRRGIWWALIKRKVSDRMDLALLSQPGHELRIEARIRVSHAPRRVNLHVNTQRTTNFHTHLMEFDIPDTTGWHTISMTTHGFSAQPGDTVFGQLALMDWGLESYRVDIDYFKVDVLDAARVGPDQGEQVPYHPPIPDPTKFRRQAQVAEDAVIDLDNPDVNLNNWSVLDGVTPKRLLTVNGTLWVILRFDLSAFAGKRVAGHGLLELTTHSVLRTTGDLKDFGEVRVVEILGGDRSWRQETVTANSLRRGEPLERVLNGQMIIDWPVSEGDGRRSYFTISRPVLQRILDGRTLGLAIKPLGSINASFYAMEDAAGRLGARLLFDVDE